MILNLRDFEREVKSRLKPKRFSHSLNVRKIALELAKIHRLDLYKVELAALGHDIAKNLKMQEVDLKMQEFLFKPTQDQIDNPSLLHGPLGALTLKNEFHVEDEDIFEAIYYHTSGKVEMGKIALAIYISDYLDFDKELEAQKEIYKMAKTDLYKAALAVCSCKLRHVISTFRPLTLESVNFYHWLINHNRKKLELEREQSLESPHT